MDKIFLDKRDDSNFGNLKIVEYYKCIVRNLSFNILNIE